MFLSRPGVSRAAERTCNGVVVYVFEDVGGGVGVYVVECFRCIERYCGIVSFGIPSSYRSDSLAVVGLYSNNRTEPFMGFVYGHEPLHPPIVPHGP